LKLGALIDNGRYTSSDGLGGRVAALFHFPAGYGDAAGDVPQAIMQGILTEVSNLYENREDVVIGQNISMLSLSERLLWPYRALAAE
jgi:hypothetical protein